MSVMEVTEIMEVLPHRYPFQMVDRIIEMDMETGRVVGIKNVTNNELYFQGHFPGNPVMPGVLQMEAMAQVAGVMLNSRDGNQGKTAYFMSMNKVKFRKMVIPGDQLRIEVVPVRMRSRMATVAGKAYVGDDLVSEGELTFGYGAE
ncbi:MAG: 3-hydroxyacyl-ACP dehydratase FabZ [Kiritimatiellaceae bacterium]|nr:3-hydroxyacyl-ACP dehydratase FabZ [Kiritimatiellaceae bacterium]